MRIDFVLAQRPFPNPPQPKNYVGTATCSQDHRAAVKFGANPAFTTVTFPKAMMIKEGFTWPPTGPGPQAAPGEGQYFSIEISRYPPGFEGKTTSGLYGAKIQFPWSELFASVLTEDSSGVVCGFDGNAMIKMTIGAPA